MATDVHTVYVGGVGHMTQHGLHRVHMTIAGWGGGRILMIYSEISLIRTLRGLKEKFNLLKAPKIRYIYI